jgi:hypothetical protein
MLLHTPFILTLDYRHKCGSTVTVHNIVLHNNGILEMDLASQQEASGLPLLFVVSWIY